MTEPHDIDPNDDALRAWLDNAADVQPSARLRRAIAEIPLRVPHPTHHGSLWLFGSIWKTAAAGLMVCVLGVAVGATTVEADVSDDADVSELSVDAVDLALALPIDEIGTEQAP